MSNDLVDLLAKLRVREPGEPAVDPLTRDMLVSSVAHFALASEDQDRPDVTRLAECLLARARRIMRAR